MSWITPTLLWSIALTCVGIGLAGTVMPALPGAPVLFLGILIGAWANNFGLIGWFPLVVCGVLAVFSLAIDFIATAVGAKKVGASAAAVIGSTVGTFVGLPFALPGIIFGPLLGAVIGELWAQKTNPDYWHISKVGLGTWLGLLVGTVAKVALACAMIGTMITSLLI